MLNPQIAKVSCIYECVNKHYLHFSMNTNKDYSSLDQILVSIISVLFHEPHIDERKKKLEETPLPTPLSISFK